MWKIFFFPLSTPPIFTQNSGIFSGKKRVDEDIAAEKKTSMVKLPAEIPLNQYFSVTPANIWIKIITPSSQASDSGKGLCAHFLLIGKRIILWRAHVFLAWYSPWHCVIRLFFYFIGWKWKWRRVNLGIFRIQPRAPPHAEGFSKSISKISDNYVVELKGRIDWWNHGIFFDKNTRSIIAI